MNITLISPYPDITTFGLRTISAYLKSHGHQTQMLMLPDPYGDDIVFGKDRYEPHTMDEMVEICRGSGLIGITLMTNFYDCAVQITKKLKSSLPNVPVIWGGIHPTIRPEECLEFADMVCVGDGEEAMLDVANNIAAGRDCSTVGNIWSKKSNDDIAKNPVRPLSAGGLDIYPMPDYSFTQGVANPFTRGVANSFAGHYALYNGHIEPLTNELTKKFLEAGTVSAYLGKIGYQTMTGRGCPHKCTYCINDTIKNLYSGKGYLRWRTTAHVINELLWVKEHMPYVGFIWISDDAFFARGLKSIEEFCMEYKEKINLPFTCLASPLTLTEEKMELLVDAGLVYLQMGVESASARIQDIFNRKTMSNDIMMKAIRIINKYKDKMYPPSYDFILDVPYETEEDKIESLRFISGIPKPFRLQPFSLVLYPETKLYNMAKGDGLIADDKRDIYAKSYTMREPNYLNLLMTLSKGGKFPSALLKLLVAPGVVSVLNARALKPLVKRFYIGLQKAYRLAKSIGGRK
ncbi:MAG: B12-binding domain-containing radical SAM protein [Nitrospirae bacterium]|nr:B12-binding domain-containing radical SAM protein [Nitrospirota bacterium]